MRERTAPPPPDLPPPAPEERARSHALAERLRAEIAAGGGAIPFARFMELALYAPGLGYYAAARAPVGAAGDFVTAPELGPLYARLLARQCAELLDHFGGGGDILEAGGGSGALAVELLRELAALGRLPRRYVILELGAARRAEQQERVRREIPELATRVAWPDGLPEPGFRGIVIANELLDALPVTRFRVTADGVAELWVGERNGNFVEIERPATETMRARIAPLALPTGYTSEIGLQAEAWVRSLAERIARGAMLLVDYGFPRAEFYHPQRAGGTLMCHYRQRVHADPYALVGLQDITAHVDFSAIAEAGGEAGLTLLGYSSQALFLLGCGLERLAPPADADARARLAYTQQAKRLTAPHEMGELFKVIALGRGVEGPLLGFSLQDRRARL